MDIFARKYFKSAKANGCGEGVAGGGGIKTVTRNTNKKLLIRKISRHVQPAQPGLWSMTGCTVALQQHETKR